MATEITARLYFDSEPDPARLFAQLVEAVAGWRADDGAGDGAWQGLRVSAGPQRDSVHRDDARLETPALIAAAARFADTAHQLSSRVAYPSWRFHGRTAERGSSLAWIEAWGDGYARIHGEDPRRIWGSAAFTISDCGPYCALLDPADPAAAALNERVEDNLERLTKLLFRVIEVARPASLKLFTDQGAYLPFNAHLAYYASDDRVLDDLRLIGEVWRRGMPGHSIPPLGELGDGQSIAFHWWRSEEARRRLVEAIAGRIPRIEAATTDDVRRALASGAFDNYELPPGFMVLEFPHTLNAFLDRFFLRVLDRG